MSIPSRQPSDHAARLRALDPAASFLVQAPAGSGKTELLTDRILALLATVSRPEEIVAITFTRKAASEMHARVLGKLGEALGPAPESEHARRSWELARAALARDAELGWQLLRHPARLAIRTIDSFCASLVRGMPCLSELGGMPELASDPQVHYAAAARATLAYADVSDEVRTLIRHMDVDVTAAGDAIADMLAQRDQWMPLLGAHGTDRETLERMLADAVAQDMQAAARAMPTAWQAALRAPARLAAAGLDEGGGDNPLAALRDWQADLACEADRLPQWQALAHLLLTQNGGLRSPKGVNKNLGFPAGSKHKEPFTQWLDGALLDASRWTARLHALRAAPPARLTDDQWRILGAQILTLQLAVVQLHERFAEAGEVDFIEIAQRAQRALGSADDPGELLLKLDASIRHLLVDEFQDTSLTQIRLLETLTAGWQAGDGRTLFLVGDPMQSIYRFRKAEVGLFLDAAEQGIGEIEPQFLSLTDNFRSQAGVVDWVNATFHGLFPQANDAAAGAIRYTRSQAFNPPMQGPAVRFHLAFGEHAADADRQAQNTTVDLVRQALAQADPDSRHPVAILVRARGHLGALVRRLTDEGIACRAVDLVPLARREVVADLVQLMRALAHPADRLAWLSVLRAPWCGLKLNSLHVLFGHDLRAPVPTLLAAALRAPRDPAQQTAQRGPWDTASEPCRAEQVLEPDEWIRLRRVADILLDTANGSGALPWAAWIESLWLRLGGAALYADGAADDAESLFALVERLAPHGGLDLARLDAALARLFAAPLSDASRADTDAPSHAVEVMTMHKSKGLQFDTVILYGLHRKPAGDKAPLVRIEQHGARVLFGPAKPRAEIEADPISRYLALREQRRSSYEVDRLLYVAATRARHALHLVAHVKVDPKTGESKVPAAGSLLGRLWDVVPAEQKQPSTQDNTRQAEEQALPPQGSPPLRRLAPEAVVQLAGQSWRQGNPGFGVQAPGSRSGWQDAGQPVWQREETYDAAIGTLAHAWLARMGLDGLQAWPPETLRECRSLMGRQLTRAGVPQSQAGHAAGVVLETLLATLEDERGRWLLSQSGARREWPLIDASGKVSVIDLAVSTEGGWLIVDYKTGVPLPGEAPADFAQRMRRRHGDQLERYCRNVTSMDGRPAQAALYFPRARAWIEL
ncbi:exodeoxyribonuclease V subunit beta [Bordetella sp. FB-8]|uniref:UvrD-helicase domain-containing protein n=1 Tax=Bordetella sp. FB-8 TaxID=1159870 RepID=UPI00036E7258|nr:UvrD-helicase domain-containing protein [Bordetella sp. FB-8]